CRECGHQTTVTAGTLFQGTRTPLMTVFAAAWLVATAEEGVSARQLARALDLGSYETAWTMLHRFRRAMVRSGPPQLEGPGAVAAVAPEDRGETPGRVRMQRLASGAGFVAFLGRVVEPGTLVRAVRLEAWYPLAELGFMTERGPALTPPAGL